MAFYIDTSALVKLVVGETETVALRSWLQGEDRDLVPCDLARTELMRSVRRVVPDRALQARSVLDALTLVDVTAAVFEVAGRLDPVGLRSLDPVHLAAALDLGFGFDDEERGGASGSIERCVEECEECSVCFVEPRAVDLALENKDLVA